MRLALSVALFCCAAALASGQDPVAADLEAKAQGRASAAPPNVILILADDLGYGELGSYGQTKIKTPHLDRLAREGMRFTQHYCGAPVCAPSRCVLMSGQSLPHARVRDNKEFKPEGQHPMGGDVVTIAELVKARGYATGGMGKWGLGPPRSDSDPVAQGFDFFYGYNCQRVAHNFYPPYLWLNREQHFLDNPVFRAHQKIKEAPEDWSVFRGREYAPDLMTNAALGFIRRQEKKPFFLYLPFVEPHLAMQPPERWVAQYPKEWDEKPYLGTRSYLPHPRPRAGYAAMISHLDEHVGRVMNLVDELGLAENTLILFTSDNGPTHDVGGVDTKFFASAGPLRGRKGSIFEGGIRVPLIARWKGKIAAASTSDHISAFQDYLPTIAELAGAEVPKAADGLSFVPALLDPKKQKPHAFLHWEFHGYGGQVAVRRGKWKLVRRRMKRKNPKTMLFDLEADLGESKDLASLHPEIVAELEKIMREDRTPNETFRMKELDRP
jgi:arylsulfatase A